MTLDVDRLFGAPESPGPVERPYILPGKPAHSRRCEDLLSPGKWDRFDSKRLVFRNES